MMLICFLVAFCHKVSRSNEESETSEEEAAREEEKRANFNCFTCFRILFCGCCGCNKHLWKRGEEGSITFWDWTRKQSQLLAACAAILAVASTWVVTCTRLKCDFLCSSSCSNAVSTSPLAGMAK